MNCNFVLATRRGERRLAVSLVGSVAAYRTASGGIGLLEGQECSDVVVPQVEIGADAHSVAAWAVVSRKSRGCTEIHPAPRPIYIILRRRGVDRP